MTANSIDPQELAQTLLGQAQLLLDMLMRPWTAYQVLIALGIFLTAFLCTHLTRERTREWLRTRQGWPKWRIRLGIILHRRSQLITFVIIIWPVIWLMREFTWPSRSYLLSIIASLATAWLLIALLTRLISNGLLRTIFRYGGWVWVTLIILNLTDEAQSLLESAAIQIGDSTLSLWLLLQAVILIFGLFILARFISRTSSAKIRDNKDISPSMQVLALKFLQVLLYGSAFFIGLRTAGVDLTGLAVLSGAIGVGLGFGLQKVVSNLVSGVIILMDKSIKPGDVISLGETFGWINELGGRYVSVVTRDGREYLIPNEDLITGQVVNWSHSNDFVRLDIYFGTSYGCDPHEVRRLAVEAAKGVERVLVHRAPVCHIVGFGDSSVDYILRFWIRDPTGGLTNIRGNVYLALWDTFKEHGITIPFPQREVRLLDEDAPVSAEAPEGLADEAPGPDTAGKTHQD